MGYRKFEINGLKQELAYMMPPDAALNLITYDPDILELACIEQESSGRNYFLSPDELERIMGNEDWQMQCRIYKHVRDFGRDYHKVPKDFRA